MYHTNLYKGHYIFIYCKNKGFSKAPFMIYPLNEDIICMRIMWEMNFFIHAKRYEKLEFFVYAIKMNIFEKKYNNIHKLSHKLNILLKEDISPLFDFQFDVYENINYKISNYAYTLQFNHHLSDNGNIYISNPIIHIYKKLLDSLLE